jgi:hypothetical protein
MAPSVHPRRRPLQASTRPRTQPSFAYPPATGRGWGRLLNPLSVVRRWLETAGGGHSREGSPSPRDQAIAGVSGRWQRQGTPHVMPHLWRSITTSRRGDTTSQRNGITLKRGSHTSRGGGTIAVVPLGPRGRHVDLVRQSTVQLLTQVAPRIFRHRWRRAVRRPVSTRPTPVGVGRPRRRRARRLRGTPTASSGTTRTRTGRSVRIPTH